jgi:[methyl-Co(III) methanol-specific corrinoid protein]:coenzyme M methyltransferase
MENTLISTIEDREKLADMLHSLMSFTKIFAASQLEAGAHMVTIADHATRNLVGPKVYGDFVKPLHKVMNKEFPNKLILHCCGNTEDRVTLFEEAGFPLYHFESANNIETIASLAHNMKLTGCVNNPTVLLNGSRKDVIEQVKNILSYGIDILSPECAVPMKTPNANLKAMGETNDSFGKRS